MRAFQLPKPRDILQAPLQAVDRPTPVPGPGQLLIRVHACGLCHTDLHTVEGDIVPPACPIIPGHQVVGRVEALGPEVSGWKLGERVGIPWFHQACVANTTYRDGVEFLKLAAEISVHATTQSVPLEHVNQALHDLKFSRIDGAGVVIP